MADQREETARCGVSFHIYAGMVRLAPPEAAIFHDFWAQIGIAALLQAVQERTVDATIPAWVQWWTTPLGGADA